MYDTFFVYGTLKRGQRNHELLASSKFLGTAVSNEACYEMIDGPFPKLYRVAEGGCRVYGELYRVTDSNTITWMDMLESNGSFYTRTVREFLVYQGEPVWAWIYETNPQYRINKNREVFCQLTEGGAYYWE